MNFTALGGNLSFRQSRGREFHGPWGGNFVNFTALGGKFREFHGPLGGTFVNFTALGGDFREFHGALGGTFVREFHGPGG